MKKVALLFTILCAGQLYGMENPQPELSAFQNLPNEVKNLIIVAFAQSGSDLDSAIKNIKIASLTNKALNNVINERLGNLKGFTAIVHLLADKFNTHTNLIADKFGTPAAKEYSRLVASLKKALNTDYNIQDVTKLIAQGADINYHTGYKENEPADANDTALGIAIGWGIPKMVKLLLDSGANPKREFTQGSPLEYADKFINSFGSTPKRVEVKKLIIEALKKQSK